MLKLNPDECRVFGVLVEKAHTTASQYPLSLNGVVTACSQKSNRSPVMQMDEDRALRALESLREKRLVTFAQTLNSRVMKYRHNGRETLQVGTRELVVLAELMLRGPQTAGEIRSRASRMHPLGSLEEVAALLEDMTGGEEPLVARLAPAPGSRAPRYAQRLCPEAHPQQPAGGSEPAPEPPPAAGAALAERVEALEARLADLTDIVRRLAAALGAEDLLS